MNHKILDTTFRIAKQKLFVNDVLLDCKSSTIEALDLFLKSDGKVISKDDLLEHIWKGVIVSDSSIFKQIEILKKLFIKAGLPDDCIENVYGKGYKLRYEIIELADDVKILDTQTEPETTVKHKYFNKNTTVFFILTSFVFVFIFIFIFSGSKDKQHLLNADKKASIEGLMKDDWQQGLSYVSNFIEKNQKRLTINDKAFLYAKKALAQHHLQDYQTSIKTYQHAQNLFEELNNDLQIGQIHLKIAGNHHMLPGSSESYEIQQQHISKAIEIFKSANNQRNMIDAQILLAEVYRKRGKNQLAIKLYEKSIKDSREINDKIGVMIATNNLAATYSLINDYDTAIELGQKGLDIALESGEGRYIANTYSFLSDLYQHQYRSVEALEMIEQAIKYQLASNEYSSLPPKIITLSFLMVQTYQFDKAQDLLKLTDKYAKSLNMKSGISIVSLYAGLNAARQNQWQQAKEKLTAALYLAQKVNFKYKQPLNRAYLALSQYFNQNYLRSIEQATTVINNESSNQQAKSIAALALAYSYAFIERPELADKWFFETENLQNPKWLFEYQLFLKLKLERQQQNNSVLIPKTLVEIEEVSKQMRSLTKSSQVDEEIFNNLKLQINKIIDSRLQQNSTK